jgi:dihydropyrimidine dehydrogenase (NAD+) subunit PreT
MKKPIVRKKIEKFELMQEALTLEDAIKESSRCLLCHDAPCSQGCPAGTDPGKFIRQIRFENYKGAARTIRNNNPLGAVCSVVCPRERLCEKNCSAMALEDTINIGGLQGFACEYAQKFGLEPLQKIPASKGKVAIIGAGPAGVGCAATLAKLGYEVTVFEKEAKAGGVARWGIPKYRLHDDLIEQDIKNLVDLGVAVKYNSPIEISDASVNKLLGEYKAIFLAIGLGISYELPFLNGYSNVMTSADFLRLAKTEINTLKISDKNVAVIGGGSVALDVISTAKALQANKAYVIALESLAELPADDEEIHIANTMHAIFKSSSQVTEVITKNGVITGLKGKEIEWLKPNNFTPANAKQIDGTEFSINVDLVVQAIGSKPAAELASFAKLGKAPGKGTIIIDSDYATNISGIFAGGDVVNGGATVVKAVGEGKAAALSIDSFLSTSK